MLPYQILEDPLHYYLQSLHRHLHLLRGLFISGLPTGFPTKTLYTPLLSPLRAIHPVHLILLDLINRKVFGGE